MLAVVMTVWFGQPSLKGKSGAGRRRKSLQLSCKARRNPVQVCGRGRWGGSWWAAIKALCTWILIGSYCGFLRKWVKIMKFEKLQSDLGRMEVGKVRSRRMLKGPLSSK